MNSKPRRLKVAVYFFVSVSFLGTLQGCRLTVSPRGEASERTKALRLGAPYSLPVEKRSLPDLSSKAALPQALEYAFNANGELEAAYREWRAALERVPQAGALKDPNLEFKTLFAAENIDSFSSLFDTVTLGVNQELPYPGKRKNRALQALHEAQAAGERFRSTKYRIQREVTVAYAQLWLNEGLADLTDQNLRLLKESTDLVSHRYHAMAEDTSLIDLQKLDVEIQRLQSERTALQIAREGLVAELNRILNRPAGSAIKSVSYPSLKQPDQSIEVLLAEAAVRNPELAALRKEIEARGVARTLAELEKRPDFMLGGELGYPLLAPTKVLMPELSLGMNLPMNRARLRAGIAEALAMRQAAEARYRVAESNTMSQLIMAIVGLRDTARIEADYGKRIIPISEQLLQTQMQTYGSGGGNVLDILDSERLLLDFRRLLLQAKADRLRFTAQLEEITAKDLYSPVKTATKG